MLKLDDSHQKDKERIHSIDTIRGFAILGIFLTNMLDFHSPILYINPYEWWHSPIDRAIYGFIDFFVQASFYPLFAMLFGFGMMTMKDRSNIKGISFTPIAVRRLSMLLLIGCLHAFFVWHGDILITYAICGVFVLFFLKWSGKQMVFFGLITYFIPNLLFSLLMVQASFSDRKDLFDYQEAIHAVDVYGNGTFMEITLQRIHDWCLVNASDNLIFLFFSIFPYILIGAGIAKLKWINNKKLKKRQLKILLLLFVLLGSLIKGLPFVFRNLFTSYVQDTFGGPLLALSYALIIILLMDKFVRKHNIFQAVGKMALSNYLFQSIFSTLVFYSYGAGLYNKISVVEGTVLAIVTFFLQVIISKFWNRHFYYGPIEWLWRGFSYWNKPLLWKKSSN